ncbi:MoxR family ATPase [Thiospirochaeta perfilievii]|uniref:MoxR family ATPase n=1 Tax=Thiospirochaeta perfilievii TaxID=252967 RepID=A0A5C1QB95_9SPIO|nr:MoxR family ATPase [Thiospirochaeta perfilievii]QEN04791.1 MoxR family ATPase [Thiospirochaeta perfilievii]
MKIELLDKLINETSQGFLGNETLVKDFVFAFVSGLHVLVEDISGVGKTTLVKSLAKASGLSLGRIQFTPDLLPGDITGLSIWDPIKREFVLKKGSIFNEFILGDEINRASPRTQSALLEAMEENSVTIDGITTLLPNPFIVVATKNPSYYIGTFEMPESQLDRFGVKLTPGYPSKLVEEDILYNYRVINPLDNVKTVTNKKSIIDLKNTVSSVNVNKTVLEFLVEIADRTRNSNNIKYGLSTRGLQHLLRFSQCVAFYDNRDYLIPEDVIYSSKKVIPHKIRLNNESIIDNIEAEKVVKQLVRDIKIPVGLK